MSEHDTITRLPVAPAVRFEPCVAFHADEVSDPVCVGCGWPVDEHELTPRAA